MAPNPTLMKVRLQLIGRLVHSFPSGPVDPDLPDRDRFFRVGQRDIADQIRSILGSIPSSVVLGEPGVRRRAKELFIQHETHKITKKWKTLTDEEKAVWENYVEREVPYNVIRQEQP